MKHIVVGTAGHIDHGKSALVRALTGTDPDRLEEEKRRGITIDLGFAHLDLGNDLRLAFVDVPGHERFVKNMLAGVGGIDLVLLVVAADESIMPQTREHFDICKLLGIQRGLVAMTKSDLADAEMQGLVKLELREMTAGSFLEDAPVVAVSSKTKEGLDRLREELWKLCLEVRPKPVGAPFRLPVDRAFVMKGFGTVVTGTLLSGTVEKDAEVEIYPSARRVRVRGIQVHNASAERAVAGQRTALNLAGAESKEIERGMVLGPPGLFQTTARMDVSLALLAGVRPLKHRARVHFHSGTAEVLAEVILLEGKQLDPGKRCYAQLRLDRAGLFLPGDRFIIRQFSPVVTIGGGEVLDSLAPKHRLGDSKVGQFLQSLETADAESRLELHALEGSDASVPALAARLGWTHAEVVRVARNLESRGAIKMLGQPPAAIIHAQHFQRAISRVEEALEKFHAANPLVAGMAKEELRTRTSVGQPLDAAASALLFNAVLAELAARGKVEAREEMASLAGRGVQLTAEEAVAKQEIAEAFEAAGLAVPGTAEVLARVKLDPARSHKILRILLKEKTLIKITEDLIFHRRALEQLKVLLADQKARNDRLSVAGFKDLTGLSRKYAIPLLEYLDRERVTRRAGDDRIIL